MRGNSINIGFFGQSLKSKSILNIEPRWWDAHDLCADSRFAKTHEGGSYFDWDADFSVDEFIMLHEKFRLRATSCLYSGHDWQAIIQPKLQAIDGAIAGTLGKISKIHILVAQWEGSN